MRTLLVAFVAGVALLQQWPRLPGAFALAACAGFGVASLAAGAALRRRSVPGSLPLLPRRLALAVAASGALALGVAYAGAVAQDRLADELAPADEGRDIEVSGAVATLPVSGERGTRFGFDVQGVATAGVHVPPHLALAWYRDDADPHPGQRWRFTVRLKRPHGACNPGGFDSELWMLEQDLRASGYVREAGQSRPPELLQEMALRPGYLVERLRDRLRHRMQQALGARRYAPVLIALVMGDQGLIAQEDWILFNRTGISHLVSISGLHITMIAAIVALAAGAAWRRSAALVLAVPVPVARAAAGTLAAWLYCLLAGWGVPAQRTFVMLATVALALSLRLRLPASTVLALAGAAVCVWDPWAVLAPGFWLSFGAVAVIFHSQAGRQPRDEASTGLARRAARSLAEAARVQAAITAGLVPLTLLLFSQISLVAPLANAVAIPVVSYLVTPLALLGAALCGGDGLLWQAAGGLLAASEGIFAALAASLNRMAALPHAWIALPAPPLWPEVLALAGIAWTWAPPGWPLRWAGLAWLVPALVWPQERPARGELWVTALDVGQGMSLVLETATDAIVFDTGPRVSDDIDAGSRIIVPYLRSRGLDRIALLVISHLDSDHSGGAPSLLRQVAVDRVLTSIPREQPLLADAREVVRCEQGQAFDIGALHVAVLGPPAGLFDAPRATTNARSCVLRIRAGRNRVLLTGDVPARQEQQIVAVAGADLAADLMVAPHHGSRTSSSDAFISGVAPRWASVQAGYRSRFGHPDPQVLSRYAAHGVAVMRSDWHGAVRWRFGPDGEVRLERWRQDHGRYWFDRPDLRSPVAAPAEADEDAMVRR